MTAGSWPALGVAAHEMGVRCLIKAGGQFVGPNLGEGPGARLSAETALLMLPMPWATSPASSAAAWAPAIHSAGATRVMQTKPGDARGVR